jgi:competence protein ComEA
MSLTVFAADKININTATQEQLTSLSGIGSKTAEAIIVYREANGAFASIEQLKAVKGIGDKKLEKLAELITVADEQ